MTKADSGKECAGMNIRELVLDLLLNWEREKTFSHKLIRDVLDKYDYLSGQEKAFFKRLAEGTIERQIELDYILDQISSVPVRKMKPLIRCLLRMSVYQIFYMDSVPDAAAVSEAVKLAGKRKFQNLKGFVNGVLRNAAKSKENIVYPDPVKEPAKSLSVRYSMPQWLVEYWMGDYGQTRTEEMLKGLLQVRPVTVRLAGRMTESERDNWCMETAQRGVSVRRHPYLPYAVDLDGAEGVAALPGYDEGAFAVQDVSSMLAVEAAGIRPGDFVLDLCAAPGGKTMLAAEKALPGGMVESRDLSEAKVCQIGENIERMGLANVHISVYDGTVHDPSMQEKADVVIADVPCSGLGVMGKKRDIKYHVTPELLESLGELQKNIVTQAAGYVKKGGTLLYSTCTVNRQENEEMVQWICQQFSFCPEDMTGYLPEALLQEPGIRESAAHGYVQLMPGIHDSDGFFFARLRRQA